MKKIISIALLATVPILLVAKNPKVYKEAIQTCSAFNDMKHKNNTNSVKLKVGKSYRIIQERKGQVLTLIDGQRIAQRWVDKECFEKGKKEVKLEPKISKATSKQNLLALSWQNAFCQTHQYKKECKSMDSKSFGAFEFVLHGLWPQPRNNQYCNVSKKQVGTDKNKQWYRLDKLDLKSNTRDELSKYMPGYNSNLHRHEWIKHGTCYGTSANEYYSDAISLLKQVNSSKVQQYFKQHIGKVVALKNIRDVFDKEFGNGAGKHVTMNCRGGLVTELWLHIGNGSTKLSELLKKGETPRSRCQKGRVDAVGF